jgi:hypothetical protein
LDLIDVSKQKSVPTIARDLHNNLAFFKVVAAFIVFAQNRRSLHKLVYLVNNRVENPKRFVGFDNSVTFNQLHRIGYFLFVFGKFIGQFLRVLH